MWDADKRSRLQELRKRQEESLLTQQEQVELASLLREVETDEAAYLAPATQRIRQEREKSEKQNRGLDALVRRKEALVQRLRDFLAEAQRERHAIESDLAAVLGEGHDLHTDH